MGTRSKRGGKSSLHLFATDAPDLLAALDPTEGSSRLASRLKGRFDGRIELELTTGPAAAALSLESPPDLVLLSAHAAVMDAASTPNDAGGAPGAPSKSEQPSFVSPPGAVGDEAGSGSRPPTAFVSKARETIQLLKDSTGTHVVYLGCSTLGQDERPLSYAGRPDDVQLSADRINLELIRLSITEGISVVDVDRIIAELGGEDHVLGPLRYSETANAAIVEELLDILEDIGFFEDRPLVEQIGRREASP